MMTNFVHNSAKLSTSCLMICDWEECFFIAFTQTVLAGEPQVVVFAVFPLKGQPIMRNSLHFSNKLLHAL